MALSVEDLNELNPEKKGKDYCIRNARNLHNSNNNANSFYFNQKIKWELNRKYMRGAQPIDNAKTAMDRNNEVNYDNLNWNVPKALPIIFDIMVGIVSRLDLDIITECIDPENVDRKTLEKYRAEAEIMLREELKYIEGIIKSPIQNPKNKYQDVEELEISVDAGDFKLDLEIAMEEVISLLFDFNRAREIKGTLVRDMANCGMGVVRHYVEKTGLIKIRRVDPVNFISNYVTTRDYRELYQAGEYMFVNMSQLRNMAGSEFSDDQYVDIALNVAGRFGNPPLANLGNSITLYQNPIGGGYIFDPYVVCILYTEWSTTDRLTHIVGKPNKFGNPKTIQVKGKVKAAKPDEPYVKNTDYKVWYGCNWILDTDYAFKAGRVEFPNVQANALNESQSTFAVAATDINNMITSTYTERMIEPMDMAYLNWMQYQSHLAKAVPPGVYAEITALTNIPNGKNGNMDPLEVLRRYTTTGNLLGNAMLPNGQMMNKPIEILNGSDYSKAVGFYQQFLANLELCKQLVGLNEFTDASNPNPEQSVGGARLAVQGTNNSLMPMITAIDLVMEKVAEGIVNRCQHMASLGQLDYLANAIGRNAIIALSVSKDLSAAAFGISIAPRMDDNDKRRIQGYIQQALAQRGTTGVGGIEVEDALAIERIRNIKAQERLFVKRREARQKADLEMSTKKQEDNAMVQGMSIEKQKQAQMEIAKQELEIYKQKKVLDLEAYEKEKQIDLKYKIPEIKAQADGKDENIITQGIVDEKLMKMQPVKQGGE